MFALAFAALSCVPLPAAKAVEGLTPAQSLFEQGRPDKPIVLESLEEAKQYLSTKDLVRLQRQVNFRTQRVLLFAWQGSGQDKLDYSVLECNPPQLRFQYRGGMTRDLRSHLYVFAIQKEASWSVQE